MKKIIFLITTMFLLAVPGSASAIARGIDVSDYQEISILKK